jgi:hypothetical protein
VRTVAEPRRRGVLFISELVPKPAITMVANLVYHEHYRTVPMQTEVENLGDERRRHALTIELGERTHRIACTGRLPSSPVASDGLEHFFKEHAWGFGRDHEGALVTYRVAHPIWNVFPDPQLELDLDFHELYGDPWSILAGADPFHVMYAEGSEITVFERET